MDSCTLDAECESGKSWAYEMPADMMSEYDRLLRPYQRRMFQYPLDRRLELLVADLEADLSKNAKLVMWAFDWPTILGAITLPIYRRYVNALKKEGVWAAVRDAIEPGVEYSEPIMNELHVDLLVLARGMGEAIEGRSRIHHYAAVGDCLLELMRLDLIANPRAEARCEVHESMVEWWLMLRLGARDGDPARAPSCGTIAT